MIRAHIIHTSYKFKWLYNVYDGKGKRPSYFSPTSSVNNLPSHHIRQCGVYVLYDPRPEERGEFSVPLKLSTAKNCASSIGILKEAEPLDLPVCLSRINFISSTSPNCEKTHIMSPSESSGDNPPIKIQAWSSNSPVPAILSPSNPLTQLIFVDGYNTVRRALFHERSLHMCSCLEQ